MPKHSDTGESLLLKMIVSQENDRQLQQVEFREPVEKLTNLGQEYWFSRGFAQSDETSKSLVEEILRCTMSIRKSMLS